jgi:hypothetical protein
MTLKYETKSRVCLESEFLRIDSDGFADYNYFSKAEVYLPNTFTDGMKIKVTVEEIEE